MNLTIQLIYEDDSDYQTISFRAITCLKVPESNVIQLILLAMLQCWYVSIAGNSVEVTYSFVFAKSPKIILIK